MNSFQIYLCREMLLACAITFRLTKTFISPFKRSTLQDKVNFNHRFDQLLADVTTYIEDNVTRDAIIWLQEVAQYTVPGGKQNRGMSVINAYQHLARRPLTHIEIDQSFVLGWCIEWLQAFFLVADDMMDNSSMRRGKLCWYKHEHVGSIAINDSFLMESCIYLLLKKHFRYHPQYIRIVELFHDITFQTEIGQTLDLITSNTTGIRYELFNFERYSAIVKYKTAYYSFYLPIALALYMRGIYTYQAHNEAKAILLKMGEYFQIQDDFLDCFGEPSIIGKVGTDIEEGKCSWLAVKAMEVMNVEQTNSFKANYGLSDVKSVQIVKEMYVNLGIPKLFKDYECSSYNELCRMIETQCNYLPRQLFFDFLYKIYGRNR